MHFYELAETPLFDTLEIKQFMAAVKRDLKNPCYHQRFSHILIWHSKILCQPCTARLKRTRRTTTTQASALDLSQHLVWKNGELWLLVNRNKHSCLHYLWSEWGQLLPHWYCKSLRTDGFSSIFTFTDRVSIHSMELAVQRLGGLHDFRLVLSFPTEAVRVWSFRSKNVTQHFWLALG